MYWHIMHWSNLRLFLFSIFLVFCDFFMSCRHVCSMGRNVRFMRWYHTPYLCHLWVEPTYLCSVHIGFHFRNRCNRGVGFCEWFSELLKTYYDGFKAPNSNKRSDSLDKAGSEKSNGGADIKLENANKLPFTMSLFCPVIFFLLKQFDWLKNLRKFGIFVPRKHFS